MIARSAPIGASEKDRLWPVEAADGCTTTTYCDAVFFMEFAHS